jgi:hypothetical protein
VAQGSTASVAECIAQQVESLELLALHQAAQAGGLLPVERVRREDEGAWPCSVRSLSRTAPYLIGDSL